MLQFAPFATRYLGAQKAYITIRKDVINNFSGQKKVLINTLKEVIQEMPNKYFQCMYTCTMCLWHNDNKEKFHDIGWIKSLNMTSQKVLSVTTRLEVRST